MNCDHDLASKYITGQLSAEERESYEEHYFQCALCYDDLQMHLALQSALQGTAEPVTAASPRGWIAWGSIAATVVVMASIGYYRLQIKPPSPQPARPDPVELLARVEPPPYQAPALRGASPEGHFRDAMEQYRAGNYAAAIDGLNQSDPKSPDVQLFLGISYLLQNQPDSAIAHLQSTLDLGDSLDLEAAHFYLAKAFLKRRDVASAVKELESAAALHGDYEKPAREMLERLR